jgi:glutaredoxin
MNIEFFHGDGCGQCMAMVPIVKRISVEMGIQVKDYNVSEMDEDDPIFTEKDITTIPVIIINGNKKSVRFNGIKSENKLRDTIKELRKE